MKFGTGAVPTGLSVFLLLLSASCNNPKANPPATSAPANISLPGTSWVLTDLAGTPALPAGKATLSFPEAGRVAGQWLVQPVHRLGNN